MASKNKDAGGKKEDKGEKSADGDKTVSVYDPNDRKVNLIHMMVIFLLPSGWQIWFQFS